MHIVAKGSTLALLAAIRTFAAHAATVYTSQAAFDAAATGLTTYTVPTPTNPNGDPYNSPLGFGPGTLTSGGGFNIYNDGSFGAGQTYIGTYDSAQLTISLSPVTAFGFNFGTYFGSETVTIDVNGSLAATIATGVRPSYSFFGITSTTPITSVDLSYPQPEAGLSEIDLLNDQIGSVAATPEPSSFARLGTGLLGVAAQLRRKFARS